MKTPPLKDGKYVGHVYSRDPLQQEADCKHPAYYKGANQCDLTGSVLHLFRNLEKISFLKDRVLAIDTIIPINSTEPDFAMANSTHVKYTHKGVARIIEKKIFFKCATRSFILFVLLFIFLVQTMVIIGFVIYMVTFRKSPSLSGENTTADR